MSQTVLQPDLLPSAQGAPRWMVVIYNNDTNSMEEVVEVLIQATGCDEEEAFIETWEADTYGEAPVHFSNKEECEGVAHLISSIGVRTEVSLEWGD